MAEGAPGEPAALAAELIAAINGRDFAGLSRLVGPGSEIVTGRNAHTGPEAIAAWAAKEYDHLTKRYAIDEYRSEGERVLALGNVQYVWTESEEVADSSPIALLIEVEGGVMRRLTVHDDTQAALLELES